MTGRARRCGWLDAALLKRSIIINGISGLCITKLDVLDGLDEIKVCVGYELRGERIDILPLDADDIVACVPIYDTLPGLVREHLRRDALGRLPQNARRYLERVESLHRRADRHGLDRPRPRAHDPAAPSVPAAPSRARRSAALARPSAPPRTTCSPTTANISTSPGTSTTC